MTSQKIDLIRPHPRSIAAPLLLLSSALRRFAAVKTREDSKMALRLHSTHWIGGCLSCLAAVLAGSSVFSQDAKPAEKVNFTDHVLPIFRAKCGTCHSAGQAKGGLVLESYA